MNVAPKAPKKARNGTVKRPRNSPVCKSANIAPNAPPDDIPRRCGSANGLRVTAWRLAPTIANPAPTIMLKRPRGNLISQIMASRPLLQIGSIVPGATLFANTPHTVPVDTATAPTEIAIDNETNNNAKPMRARYTSIVDLCLVFFTTISVSTIKLRSPKRL